VCISGTISIPALVLISYSHGKTTIRRAIITKMHSIVRLALKNFREGGEVKLAALFESQFGVFGIG
jgi:hypothetical protein